MLEETSLFIAMVWAFGLFWAVAFGTGVLIVVGLLLWPDPPRPLRRRPTLTLIHGGKAA